MNSALKELLGNVPGAATLYSVVRPGRPRTRYNLEQLAKRLPAAVEETRPHAGASKPGTRLLLFATLHYWIEQAAIVGLALRGLGHNVTIAYLPYSSWEKSINRLDLHRQDLYTRQVLAPLADLIRVESLLAGAPGGELPQVLNDAVVRQSEYDAMYSLQNEEVDRESDLYKLRLQRNRAAMSSSLQLIRAVAPDVVLIPNGLVTELGTFYQAARHLNVPTTTYEFNDQREQIWLAQNDIVMFQNTEKLWEVRHQHRLADRQREEIAAFVQARRSAQVYGKGTRRWQDAAAEGGQQVRRELDLDNRPIVLLPTNVLGDSLTLGRHVFAASMAEWIEATVRYFISTPGVQLVVRVHPGERLTKGTSMMQVVQRTLPAKSGNIRVVGPSDKINTYDVMDIADLGLVYTTTTGLEMAMRGVPVIVAGNTHYRGRGFTMDPSSWQQYFEALDQSLVGHAPKRLAEDQVETAWNYAYRFFFEYPFDFPWRLMHFWGDLDVWPIRRVLSDEGRETFESTFRHLAGEPFSWQGRVTDVKAAV